MLLVDREPSRWLLGRFYVRILGKLLVHEAFQDVELLDALQALNHLDSSLRHHASARHGFLKQLGCHNGSSRS